MACTALFVQETLRPRPSVRRAYVIGPNSRHTSTRRRQHEPSNNGLSARMTVTAYHAFLSFPSRQTKREEKSLIPPPSPSLFAIGPQNALVPGYSCVLTVNTLPLSPPLHEKWPRQKEPSSIHAFPPPRSLPSLLFTGESHTCSCCRSRRGKNKKA